MLQSDIYENWSQIPSISSNRNHLPGVFRWIFCSKSLSCFPSLFSSWCSVTLSLSAGLLERLVTSNSVLPSLRHSLPPVCPLLLSLYMSLPNSSSVGLLERSALNPEWLLCSINDRKAENSKLSQKGRSGDAKDRDRKIRKEGRRTMSCRPGGGGQKNSLHVHILLFLTGTPKVKYLSTTSLNRAESQRVRGQERTKSKKTVAVMSNIINKLDWSVDFGFFLLLQDQNHHNWPISKLHLL